MAKRTDLLESIAPIATPAVPTGDDLTMLDITETCRFFGGANSPLHPTTLYKGIKAGKYPAPVKQGPATSRWVLGSCREALRKIIAGHQAA